LFRSLSPLIAAFLAAEIAVAVLPRLRLRSASLLHGMPDDPDQAKLFCQTGSALRIAGCGYRMVGAEVPSRPVLLHRQPMASSEMPSEHLAAPPAFEANDMVAMNGSPDRHCGSSLFLGFCRRLTEADERSMNSPD